MSAALLRVVTVLVIGAMVVPRLDRVERSIAGFGMTVVLLVAAVLVMFRIPVRRFGDHRDRRRRRRQKSTRPWWEP
jgi:hypothetical protein